jgi:hypothetical protein
MHGCGSFFDFTFDVESERWLRLFRKLEPLAELYAGKNEWPPWILGN